MRLSIVIPVLNSERTLPECLAAIRGQTLPRTDYEIVIADAGSSDRTLEIAREAEVDVIVPNPLRTGEAGKTAGIKAAHGEIIALVDSDNILPDPGWLARMLAPFADPEIIATEPIAYTVRAEDPAITRYFALLGMNDPICLFTRNYDRICAITNRWTGLPLLGTGPASPLGTDPIGALGTDPLSCADGASRPLGTDPAGALGTGPAGYLKIRLTDAALPTIGANGFVFRRELLDGTNWDPYLFDIDILYERIRRDGSVCVAKVKTGIVHLYCAKLGDFARKQKRRIRDFLYFAQQKQRSYPWDKQKRTGILLFCLSTATILPLIVQMCRGWWRRHDVAWLYHVPVCVVTLWVYGCGTLAKVLGRRAAPVDRTNWQKK